MTPFMRYLDSAIELCLHCIRRPMMLQNTFALYIHVNAMYSQCSNPVLTAEEFRLSQRVRCVRTLLKCCEGSGAVDASLTGEKFGQVEMRM